MCLRPAVFSWVASLSDAHVSICFSCEANRCFLDKCYPLPQWTFCLSVFAILVPVCVCVSICGRGPALASHFQLCSQSVACRITNSEGCSRSHQHNLVQRRPKGCILRSFRFGSSMSFFRGVPPWGFILHFLPVHTSLREPYDFRLRFDFDHTLGFPGEGPVYPQPWSIATINIGSLKTSTVWRTCEANVTCLQETRIGTYGLHHASKTVEQQGTCLFHGRPLPGLLSTHGVTRTPHGGVAILAARELATEFRPQEDATGLYDQLYATRRVTACWVQVQPTLKLLAFSFYGKTGASADKAILEFNDNILRDIFTVASQFGEVPIVIAGDFQVAPEHYTAVTHAVHYHQWCDVLQSADDDGGFRPLTFSSNGCFTGPGDGCSSIDGIITNSVASAALTNAEVLPYHRVQHRPVRASFNWKVIWQRGHTLFKPAPFTFPPSFSTDTMCEDVSSLHHLTDVNQIWSEANRQCVDTLTQAGAAWGSGPKQRGVLVQARPKNVCPGQCRSGAATTTRSSWLINALKSLLEIQAFHSQEISSGVRHVIAWRTIVKAWTRLFKLRAPCLWPCHSWPTLVEITAAIQWTQDALATYEIKLKLRRIQRWKEKIQDSARIGSAFVYRHLKNKTTEEPPNLVTDCSGNIIAAPADAIAEINSQWDEVYSVNLGFPHPLKMLEIVWPHIHHFAVDYPVPNISARALQDVVRCRRKDAAPGLDGWRTIEMQVLPESCFEPFAHMFRLIEDTNAGLPKMLATAKQIILNKNGSSEPLQKRLITLLPVILLAYTGARFRHLRGWQMQAMPQQLQGGIPSRQMSAIHTNLALTVEQAKSKGTPLIGIKIDKAKCFDRIIPQYAGALMLAFGVAKSIVAVFLKLYDQLDKHLQFKSWFAPQPTHSPNGVAQGCSLSLVAINVHMKVWVHLLAVLPEVTAQAFVDDAYLWVKLLHQSKLNLAIQITQAWDDLVGQAMNWSKCTVWGSTAAARKSVRSLFPQMQFALELEVLGVQIQTSDKLTTHFGEKKLAKIIADIKNIAVLPIPLRQKARLLGAKVIPQCSYVAALNQIPARMIARIQAEIVNVFWHKRPHWRSRFLALALLTQPHRVDPVCARHYNVILDCYRYLQMFPNEQPRFRALLANDCHQRATITQSFRQAFRFFSFDLDPSGLISFRGRPIVDFLALSLKDVKPMLKQMAVQACYAQASLQSRKDLQAPAGVIDPHLTCRFPQGSPTEASTEDIPLHAYFEAQLVGCVLTNDRLAAAKLVDEPKCRMCHAAKESLPHLVRECPGILSDNPPPVTHDLGRNFELLGIVEHPWSVFRARCRVSDPMSVETPVWSPPFQMHELWTDGSVQWPEHFLIMCAGFAVVNCIGDVISSGPVHQWALSSYTAELWAALVAFSESTQPVQINSDCKMLVEHICSFVQTHQVESSWPHQAWWRALAATWEKRKCVCETPLGAKWIPAHKLESIPEHIYMIDEDMARANHSTVIDIVCNRKADHAAKRAALKHALIDPALYDTLCRAVEGRHVWLAQLCKLCGQDTAAYTEETDNERLDDNQPAHVLFPLLPWGAQESDYPARFGSSWPVQPPRGWKTAVDDWTQFGCFISSLHWREQADLRISYNELAILFAYRKFKCECLKDEFCTYAQLTGWLKNAFAVCRRHHDQRLFPGEHAGHVAHTWGKSMPPGSICGGRPFFSDAELSFMVAITKRIAGSSMSQWCFPVKDLFV